MPAKVGQIVFYNVGYGYYPAIVTELRGPQDAAALLVFLPNRVQPVPDVLEGSRIGDYVTEYPDA